MPFYYLSIQLPFMYYLEQVDKPGTNRVQEWSRDNILESLDDK